MEYLNLDLADLNSEEYRGSEPVERGTWLSLIGYCAHQENGGLIAGAKEWKDRKCQQVLGITRHEMLRDCALWSFEGDDLRVMFYPLAQEEKLRAKREAGRLGGQASSEAKTQAARVNGRSGGRSKNPSKTQAEGEAETEAKAKQDPSENPTEGNSKVREGKVIGERESVRDADIARKAEQIVAAFPRRERYAEALMSVKRQLASGESFEAMLAGTKAAAAFLATAPSAAANKYSPSALRFFEDKRWMDDPATLIRPPAGAVNGHVGKGEMSAEEVALQLGGRGLDY
ncbi:hypothetical protein OKA04_23350 [Luteolibacter flavescens]|uniref:DUF1376 domain-containing protein n=1 Tax=Luteolibacter flavescens TaxID=1859460 RepID=A0ABT3FVV8_9BACT|nr:hypothetical protein [Luteolibacter flavescens]MCW1887693.1 hypothetical protein [Luteolibacter flavescens]